MLRQLRKLEHLQYALALKQTTTASGFADLHLVHQSLSELSWMDIDTSTIFMGKRLQAPILINAMTGGHPQTTEINRQLAGAARRAGIAMAVGSQKAALEDPGVAYSYAVTREENPDGVILANLSASCTIDEAKAAVQMVAADGLQLYLNTPQELTMREGEPDARGVLQNISFIARKLPVPVVVKEVGFGLSRETVNALYQAGIRYMDIGGFGGTNFVAIEGLRKGERWSEMEGWGIPTAISLLEGLSLELPIFLVASGGLSSALDVVKSLVAGAGLSAMAGPFLRVLAEGAVDALDKWVDTLIYDVRKIMLMQGAANIAALKTRPLVITGFAAEWLNRRGVDIDKYAR